MLGPGLSPGPAGRLLGVFAHPDDEVFCAGGTLARATQEGVEVMLVTATCGERGQIRDPAAATRDTLGVVRQRELGAAAAELGVQHVEVLGYPDGALQHHRSSVGAEVADIMGRFAPDAVITFGGDGGSGHPDHVAISEVTTDSFRGLADHCHRGQRLYHAVFPRRPTCLAEELAHWIADSGQRLMDGAALRAITALAGGFATMGMARDDVYVEWFPPGMAAIEPGEPADALYLILTGTAEALVEHPQDHVILVRQLQAGDFFGEGGLLGSDGKERVIARDSLTCLVLSRTPRTPYTGRGANATGGAEPPTSVPLVTGSVDVTGYLDCKLRALARHRTQYPMAPSMLPRKLWQKTLGTEFFRVAATCRPDGAMSRPSRVPRYGRWQSGVSPGRGPIGASPHSPAAGSAPAGSRR